jgi:hypothetical protein
MPEYKKQHYLPAAYLKYFSDDQAVCNRKSWFWRYDGKEPRRVPVETQCFADYFYSKKNAAESEQGFKRREVSYCSFVDELRAGKEPSRISHGDLFLNMADLHLRNAIHKNLTEDEGLEAYNVRLVLFFGRLLLGETEGESSLDIGRIKKHLFDFWRMEIIPSPRDIEFVTSDNPSVFATCKRPLRDGKPPLQLIFTPLDPHYVAVAFDRRCIAIRQQEATLADVAAFNLIQTQAAENCVYKASPFKDSDVLMLQKIFGKRTKAVCEVTDEGWRSYLIHLPEESRFSFMQLTPPLM